MDSQTQTRDPSFLAQKQAQYILRLSQLRDSLLREEEKRLTQSLNRFKHNFGLSNDVHRQNHSKEKNAKAFGYRKTGVSLVKNAECILWNAQVEGRRLLDPLDPLFDNSSEDDILCITTMKNLARPSARSSNSDVHDIMFAQRSRLLDFYCQEENKYRNPRNSPVNFTPEFPVSLEKRQQPLSPFKKSSLSAKSRQTHGRFKFGASPFNPDKHLTRKKSFPNQKKNKLSKSEDSFYLESKGLYLDSEVSNSLNNRSLISRSNDHGVNGNVANARSNRVSLPQIKMNSTNLPDMNRKKPPETGKRVYEDMFDKDALSIGYRLPKQSKQKSPEKQVWTQVKDPPKRLNITSPPLKSEYTFEAKLPSIGNPVLPDRLFTSTHGTKLAQPKEPFPRLDLNPEKILLHVNSRDQSNQCENKKYIVVKMPQIDFQSASPEPIINASGKSPKRPKLTLRKALTQSQLREKEVRNLLEDVKELTDIAENLNRFLNEKDCIT